MMLSLDTAYRSFGGEVEASSTPTICRLSDSRRHQLWAIAPRPIRGRYHDSGSQRLHGAYIGLGSRLIKSIVPRQLPGRQRLGSFEPASYRAVAGLLLIFGGIEYRRLAGSTKPTRRSSLRRSPGCAQSTTRSSSPR